MTKQPIRFTYPALCLAAALSACAAPRTQAQEPSNLRIAPLGNTVELELDTSSDDSYILETHPDLTDSAPWKPLMEFKGNAAEPRNWVDPIDGDPNSKFFRLRKLSTTSKAEASDFRLITVRGNARELYYEWPSKGIILFLTGDNLDPALEIQAELDSLRQTYGEKQLLTWIISVSDLEDREALAEATLAFSSQLPVLQDINHVVTRTLGSGTTPEALLIDTRDWSISYRGPASVTIDTGESEVNLTPLRDAVQELFDGQSPIVARMATIGNPSGVDAVPPSTYSEQIAPMLQNNCFPCHTPGDIAPWSMSDYATILEYSRAMKSAVLAGEMPPWHADPKYSVFSNSKALSKDEISTLIDWIDRGSPRGNGPDPLVENPPQPPEDWPLGPPDAIITLPTATIPASGVVDYLYLQEQSPFDRDVWLKAVSIKPGNRSVVHHCLVFKGNQSELIANLGGLRGFFAGYVPGMEQVPFPPGTGKRLKQSDIVAFQMHYTVNGTSATDQTQMGFYLADGPPEKELVTSSAYNISFTIPPRSAKVYVDATTTFDKASTLYEFSPHMHYRGSSARYTLNYPDGTSEILLNVPQYFFDWQALYRLETPLDIPAGTVIHCEGTFDNSSQNEYNPDPNDTVTFGQQSWEEMFIAYFNYTEQ